MDIISKAPDALEKPLRPTMYEAIVEIIAKVALVGGAGIFITTLASATQVWQYPHPRSILLFMAFSAAGIALFSAFALVFLAFGRAALIKHGPLAHIGFRRFMFAAACLNLTMIIINWPMLEANTYALFDCGWRTESMEMCNRTLDTLQTDADRRAFEAEARTRLGSPRYWMNWFAQGR